MPNYYLMINGYRSSTGHGFSNTWIPHRCRSRKEQQQILQNGLPVTDVCYSDGRSLYSTMGIRIPTPTEYSRIHRSLERGYGEFEIETIYPNGGTTDYLDTHFTGGGNYYDYKGNPVHENHNNWPVRFVNA